MMTRRDFLKKTAIVAGGMLIPVSALEVLSPQRLEALDKDSGVRWGFLVDTERCVGCGFCVKACKLENDVPYEANASRTWVERYVVTKDGQVHADSPKAARDGFITPDIDQNESGMLAHRARRPSTRPSSSRSSATSATTRPACRCARWAPPTSHPTGVVLVDRKWCIGCGYCIMACPYGARFFHPTYHTAEKCKFCYHRIIEGLQSACVQACPFGARQIGNLKDPDDPVTKTIITTSASAS